MAQHRNINPWHLLSLVLAFVAGAAIFSNPRWLGGTPSDANSSIAFEHSDEPVNQLNQGVVAVSDASNNDDKAEGSLRLPAPDNIPLYLQNEIEDLREQADRAREQIDELQQSVSELSADVEGGRVSQDNINAPQESVAGPQPVAATTPNRGRRNRGINREALVQAGVDALLIDDLQQRQDQQALARLNLLDRAAREGYSGTERLDNELDELRESSPDLQEELGDAAYDRYLFNAGRTNRVQVSSILNGSIASLAGVELGDIIYQYGSTRVFNTRGLVSAIREGVRDEPVLLSIIREGQPLVFDVTRAPLGVNLNGIRQDPNL